MKNTAIYSFLCLVLCCACNNTEIEECEPSAASHEVMEELASVRTVPLYVCMEKAESQTRALPSDYGVNFWTSLGEPSPNLSVARNLLFYVFQRDAGETGDFLYNQSLSGTLNSSWPLLRWEENYYGRPFWVREFQFKKQEGKEYKILVTASGEVNEDRGSRGTQVPGLYAANCPLVYRNSDGSPLTEGSPLSLLQAAIQHKTTKEPKIQSTARSNLNYDNDVNVYSLQENFYGFCEQQSTELEDVHVITFEDKTALRAFLYRNVAKVIFNVNKMYYGTLRTSFQWIGIYANNLTTQTVASSYDAFKHAHPETGWKLLTYFNDDNDNSSPRTVNDYGDHEFHSTDMGSYQLVTYMLPTTTAFQIRISTDYSSRYCNRYKVPIRKINSASGSAPTGVVEEIITSNDYIKIERNKEYVIDINYRVLIKGSNDLRID